MARRVSGLLTGLFSLILTGALHAQSPALSPQQSSLLDHVSEGRLRADVEFLASDALEGRHTPSTGLTQAGDYIAKQFRDAGLEPVNGSYFQIAPWNETTVRNVVGLLPGSGAALQSTYVIVSAHYDHLGTLIPKKGSRKNEDLIFNGANDDASGVAAMIEIARALSAANPHPARSVLFIAYFGEESGELGSYYYAEHPLVPITSTIAQLNLEQLGRPHKQGRLLVTGYSFSSISTRLADAARAAGEQLDKSRDSDHYFALSDNLALALHGIPAHTVSTAFEFKDHHRVTDSAEKLDYEDLARATRALALGVAQLASEEKPPEWNAKSHPAAQFAEAAGKLQAAPAN